MADSQELVLYDSTLQAIRVHAEREYPRECCGLIVIRRGKEIYVPCKNLAESPTDQFVLDSHDWAKTEEGIASDIVKIVHSHPNVAPNPSQADLVECERSNMPWLIISWPTGNVYEFEPTGYKAPLVGRSFHHGVLDCFSVVRDYFQSIGIIILDFERQDGWWLQGKNLYLDNFEKAGFRKVSDLKESDVILIQLASDKANHAAVYLGNNIILHHPQGRLSSRNVYGGYWMKNTVAYLRHEAFV